MIRGTLAAMDATLITALGQALAAIPAPRDTTQAGLLLTAVSVLAGVIVYLHRDAKADRKQAKADCTELNNQLTLVRTAQVTAAHAAAERLVEAQKSHTAALMDLQAARIADGNVTKEQLVHLVRQCAAVLTATGASLDAVQEINTEMLAATREVAGEVRRANARPHH